MFFMGFLLWLLDHTASAFSVAPHMKTSEFYHMYSFPRVSYHLALRRMHEPEYMLHTQLGLVSPIDLRNISNPFKYEDFCSITFECSCSCQESTDHKVHMYTMDPCKSSMVISKDERPYVIMDLHVEPNGCWSVLRVNGTITGGPDWVHRNISKSLSCTKWMDLCETGLSEWTRDPRLSHYRSMALRQNEA